jgi:predicted nucleic acid-binding protein
MPTVSNTSPLFNLASIGHLDLLYEQFQDIWIPDSVRTELRQIPNSETRQLVDQALHAGRIRSRATTDSGLINLLLRDLHRGEAEAIALALEMGAEHVLIDERDGRLLARQLGLKPLGVLGVLLRAKREHRIESVKGEIDALRTNARFFIAPELEQRVLALAGE